MHFRIAPATTALVVAGLAANALREYVVDAYQASVVANAEAEKARRLREQEIMDMYGDRSSLADIERAAKLYAASEDKKQ